ncbi:MAG: outer membrane beta-barrel protein [Pseudomonadota bacterium]
MYKKNLLAAIIFAAATQCVFAGNIPYVGVKLALDTGSWDFNNPAGNKFHFGSNGEVIGIFGGLSTIVAQKYYLAGEGFANASSTNTANKIIDGNGTTAKLRTTYSYGLSFLPGFKISSDTLLYVRAGLIRTLFELSQHPGGNRNNVATGGQAGIGLSLSLGRNLDLRGEYTYTAYASFNSLSNKISPRSNELSVGFVYKIL